MLASPVIPGFMYHVKGCGLDLNIVAPHGCDAIRVEIADLRTKFPPKQVPFRVLNGSHQEVFAWKKAVDNPPYHIRFTPGDSLSGRELIEIRDMLAAFIQSVN